ncbi:B-cell lymphoma 3 protein homolog isoform 2-T2 [Salvelinus alpinus]
MRRTMTMNGHQTQTTVPLDLRTTKRECGNGAAWTPTSKGLSVRVRVPYPTAPLTEDDCPNGNPSPTVEPLAHRCGSSLIKPPVNTGNPAVLEKKHSPAVTSHTPFTPNPDPYPGYPFYSWPSRSPLVVNVPVSHLQSSLYPTGHTEHLLADVAQATCQDDDGDTALHIAVVQGQDAQIQRMILLLGLVHTDLDIYNNLRQTPLHLAVITHQAQLVEALLRAGADPRALDRNGQTTVHLCCEHGQQACLSVVLSHPSILTCLEVRNYEGLTPLHLAVQGGHKELVRMLLDAGADINAMDIKSGHSPLIHAVENNNMDMVHFLIENDCNVNGQSYSGNTALHCACGRGQVDTARLLLKNRADSSVKNYHNDTPAMVAKNKKVTDVLRGKGSRNQQPKPQCVPASPHRSTPHSQNRGSPSFTIGHSHSFASSPQRIPFPQGTSHSLPSQPISREPVRPPVSNEDPGERAAAGEAWLRQDDCSGQQPGPEKDLLTDPQLPSSNAPPVPHH